MTPIKRWLALTLLLGALPLVAAPPAEETVKVFSGLCKGGGLAFRGTGVLLSHAGKNYVLTSEHVVLHGNEAHCHFIGGRNAAPISATLRLADWGRGLALLEVTGSLAYKPRALGTIFKIDAPARGQTVYVTGYPFDSTNEPVSSKGSVLLPASARHYVPGVAHLIEIERSHGEFGMSGGPVYDAGHDRVVGILSHQYLTMVPGKRTEVGEFAEKSTVRENQLLVIPTAVALRWMSEYLDSPETSLPTFRRDPTLQLQRRNVVFAAGLSFEAIFKSIPEVGALGSGEGVGGGSGEGVGGGSGEGVGGTTASSGSGARVVVSLDPTDRRTRWYLPRLSDWIVALRAKALLPWNRIEIPYFVRRNESNGQLRRVDFGSLAEFFYRLAQPDLEPIVLIRSEREKPQEQITALQVLGTRIVARVEKMKGANDSLPASLLLDRLKLVGSLLGEAWQAVRVGDLESIEKDADGWKSLFNHQFEASEGLYEDLVRAKDLLRKLKL